jgi:uncharacterized protein
MSTDNQPSQRTVRPSRPWYRQFWPWFLVAIAGWGVVSSAVTATIAFSGADEVITYQQGRALSKTSWRDSRDAQP